MSWASICNDQVLIVPIVVDGSLHAVPTVLDVVEISPNVARADDTGVVGLEI